MCRCQVSVRTTHNRCLLQSELGDSNFFQLCRFAKTIKPLPMSKAIRAVYRTDEDAIAPEAAKDKRETTDSKRQSGGGTGSRPSSMFFGSWGRKEGAAAAAAAAKKEEEAEVEKDKKVNGEEDEAESMKKRIEAKAREEEQKEKERKEEEDRLKSQEELDPRRRERAEARLAALNPMGRVDFYMPLEGYSLLNSINQYTVSESGRLLSRRDMRLTLY